MVNEIFKKYKIIGKYNDALRYIIIYETKTLVLDLDFFRNKTMILFIIMNDPTALIITLGEEYTITNERLMAAESLLGIINAQF